MVQLTQVTAPVAGVILQNFPQYVITETDVYSTITNKFLVKTLSKRNRKDPNSKCDVRIDLKTADGKRFGTTLHRLLAMAYIPNPENKPEVNHIDGNPMNNKLENLEWVTKQENTQHAIDNKLYTIYVGCKKYALEYTEEYVCTFSSATQALQQGYGTDLAHIRNACNKNTNIEVGKVPYTSGGYVFRDKTDTSKASVELSIPTYNELDIDKVKHKQLTNHPRYLLTIDGRLYDKDKAKWISVTMCEDKRAGSKYLTTTVHIDGRNYKTYRLAKLMASTWLGESNDNVYFKDSNPLNCHLDNLYYDRKGTTDKPVNVYRLLSREVEVKEYTDLVSAADALGDSTCNVNISEVIIKNNKTPQRLEFAPHETVYTYKGYVFRAV